MAGEGPAGVCPVVVGEGWEQPLLICSGLGVLGERGRVRGQGLTTLI